MTLQAFFLFNLNLSYPKFFRKFEAGWLIEIYKFSF